MSEYETEDLHSVETLDIRVRIWHDDAHGMEAEPLSYKIVSENIWYLVGQDTIADRIVKSFVAEEYDEGTLNHFLETDPAFEGVPYDEPPVSQQEFQDMRI